MESTGRQAGAGSATDCGVIVGRALAWCLVGMMHYLASKQQAQGANSVVGRGTVPMLAGIAQGQGVDKEEIPIKRCMLESTSTARTSSVLQSCKPLTVGKYICCVLREPGCRPYNSDSGVLIGVDS
jgi:hypothetical protein